MDTIKAKLTLLPMPYDSNVAEHRLTLTPNVKFTAAFFWDDRFEVTEEKVPIELLRELEEALAYDMKPRIRLETGILVPQMQRMIAKRGPLLVTQINVPELPINGEANEKG